MSNTSKIDEIKNKLSNYFKVNFIFNKDENVWESDRHIDFLGGMKILTIKLGYGHIYFQVMQVVSDDKKIICCTLDTENVDYKNAVEKIFKKVKYELTEMLKNIATYIETKGSLETCQ